jgi:phosphoribosylformylglycinamidine synthase
MNAAGNIMGMMPHPERASDATLRHTDGQKIFASLIKNFVNQEVIFDNMIVERS